MSNKLLEEKKKQNKPRPIIYRARLGFQVEHIHRLQSNQVFFNIFLVLKTFENIHIKKHNKIHRTKATKTLKVAEQKIQYYQPKS